MDFIEKKYQELLTKGRIDAELYDTYQVKRGLRNANGTGVLVGLTKVAEVDGYKLVQQEKKEKDGILLYRGYDLKKIIEQNETFSFEKTMYLLLFSDLPTEEDLKSFKAILSDAYPLPMNFVENIILKNPSSSIMNHLMRCVLSLYSYDENPDSVEPLELLKKGIAVIAKMPALVSYSLQAKTHYLDKDTLSIHYPKKEYSFAENLLYLSRNDGGFTALEAELLDMCLTVHADHGGGNNSAFVGTVVASTHTDLYSMLTASLASLKGPKHGGANQKALDMMNTILEDVKEDASDAILIDRIERILAKDYFDKSGLVYGIGHAIYTKSDPRCEILKKKASVLARSKGNTKFAFFERFEVLAVQILSQKKGMQVCANVDFYSGLIYEMLGIPRDLFLPIFACARTAGWIAHNMEGILYCDKICRPATKYVGDVKC